MRWLWLVTAAVCGSVAWGDVTRFEVTHRERVQGGAAFGDRGAYLHLKGRVHFAVKPSGTGSVGWVGHAPVTDLGLAPRDASGAVTFWADFEALTPEDPAKSNRAVLYEVNNRGNKLALSMFCYGSGNDLSKPEALGDAFLLRHGFTILWSGWDGELIPDNQRLRLSAPPVRGDNGPITGPVRCEVVVNEYAYRTLVVPWTHHGSYRPVPERIDNATLSLRERPGDERVVLPREQWVLHVSEVESDNPTQLPKLEIEVPAGLRPGWIYELIYTAQDPVVMGAGLLSVGELIDGVKEGSGAGNPFVVGHAKRPYLKLAYAFGVSQSGRFLRQFLHEGFNLHPASNKARFDVVIPHVAGGGLGSFNHRFAQPTRHGSQHDHHDYPPDRFPFAYEEQVDPLSGLTQRVGTGSLNDDDCWVFHTQSAAEYWTRAGSLPHTDPLGQRDARPPETVRFYSFGGTQHGPAGFPPAKGLGQNLANPGDYKPFLRALITTAHRLRDSDQGEYAIDRMPPSVMPRINDGTLLPWRDVAASFPKIPGVKTPEVIHEPFWLFWGERWHTERIIDVQPPRVLGRYRVLTPKVDADGNDLGCLLPPEVAVPVATYTGWNLRSATAGAEDQLVSLVGSYLPFPATKADREQTGDPRASLQERYGSHAEYVRRLTAECRRLHATGWLTAEDAERLPKLHAERTRPLFAKFDAAVR